MASGSLRRLAAAAGRRNGVEGCYAGSRRGQGMRGGCFDSLTHRERAFNLARCGVCLGAQVEIGLAEKGASAKGGAPRVPEFRRDWQRDAGGAH